MHTRKAPSNRRSRPRRGSQQKVSSDGHLRSGIRISTALAIAIGGFAVLAVVSSSAVSHIDQIRSLRLPAAQAANSFYSCLEDQLHHIIPAGSEVWIDTNSQFIRLGPALPIINNPLRIVVPEYAIVDPVRGRHIALVLVRSRSKDACLGMSIEKQEPRPRSQATLS